MAEIGEKPTEEIKDKKDIVINKINNEEKNKIEKIEKEKDKIETKNEEEEEEEEDDDEENEEEEDDQEENEEEIKNKISNKEVEKNKLINKEEIKKENIVKNEENKGEPDIKINEKENIQNFEENKNGKMEVIETGLIEDNKENKEINKEEDNGKNKENINKEKIEDNKDNVEKGKQNSEIKNKNKERLEENKNETKEDENKNETKEDENKNEIKKDENKIEIKEKGNKNETKKDENKIVKEDINNKDKESKPEKEINNNKEKNDLKYKKQSDDNKQNIYNKKEKEQKEKKLEINDNDKEEEESERPHYVFYYRPNKRPNDNGNNIESMSYYNGKTRPNHKFYCSFGTSKSIKENIKITKPNYNKIKNQNINAPIGIASTSFQSQKKQIINIVPPRTALKTTKNTNIFKPVPKAVLQTEKIKSRYQPRKYEDYRKNTNIININRNNSIDYELKTSNQIKEKPKLKYYARCPHCNFPLNDEAEVKKYYKNINYNFNSYNINKNINQKSKPYEAKTVIKNENNEKNKFNLRNENKNNNNNNHGKNFYSPKKSENFGIRRSAQNSMHESNQNSTLTSPNNYKHYPVFGTANKVKNTNRKF